MVEPERGPVEVALQVRSAHRAVVGGREPLAELRSEVMDAQEL
ncbi:hypothetical protein [Pirellulimonas nuda]|nr:hypothetical protein [Pirellulimonas nuda]